MTDHSFSRRKFLRGLGGASLAIPFLPSMHTKAFASEASSKKLILMYNSFGTLRQHWTSPNPTEIAPNVFSRAFQSSSDLPPVLQGTPFADSAALRSKTLCLNGIDAHAFGHSKTQLFAGCPSPDYLVNSTIDHIIANSAAFSGKRRLPNFKPLTLRVRAPKGEDTRLASYLLNQGDVSQPFPFDDPTDLYNVMVDNISSNGDSTQANRVTNVDHKSKMVDLVLEDYNQLMNHPRITQEERNDVTNIMDLYSDIQGQMQAFSGQLAQCDPPESFEPIQTSLYQEKFARFLDLVVGVLQCDLADVVFLPTNVFRTPNHGDHTHWMDRTFEFDDIVLDIHRDMGKWLGNFVQTLDDIVVNAETRDTLLDQSLLVWGYEYGHMRNNFAEVLGGGGTGNDIVHSQTGRSLVLAGGANNSIQTGKYLEYKQALDNISRVGHGNLRAMNPARTMYKGKSHNQLLETILLAFDMDPQTYSPSANRGFGAYTIDYRENRDHPDFIKSHLYEVLKDEVPTRGEPLPYMLV